ncbi:MAG: RNase P subunit p30 family protein [Nanoarchaeota archaeon]
MDSIIISEKDFQKARKKIREANKENKQVIFSSNDDDLNRKILEKEEVNVLLINMSGRKDRMKQRDSGFNHVIAKLTKKKDVIIGINLDEIISSRGKEKLEIIGRVRQNVKLCNKNKVKMKFISKEKCDIYNLKSLGLVLGMPTWMTKDL